MNCADLPFSELLILLKTYLSSLVGKEIKYTYTQTHMDEAIERFKKGYEEYGGEWLTEGMDYVLSEKFKEECDIPNYEWMRLMKGGEGESIPRDSKPIQAATQT